MTRVWKVVPVCAAQNLDVRPEDLLNGGDFRKCNTYRGGGGYDRFPYIYEKRKGRCVAQQFVVQLYGCNLDCPYCYVTRAGVWGETKPYTTEGLIKAFVESEQEIFHLMGGAPALYLEGWPEIMRALPEGAVFHSDFMLTEKPYNTQLLQDIVSCSNNSLFAVNIKGTSPEDYKKNTGKTLKEALFWGNLSALVESNTPFYLTFTNPDTRYYGAFVQRLEREFGSQIMRNSFVIGLIDYQALSAS